MSVTTLQCSVEALETLSGDVSRVTLRLPGEGVPYAPGQYLELKIEVEGQMRWIPFSIGNAFRGDGLIELHILKVAESASNRALHQRLQLGETFDVRLPKGDSVFQLGATEPLLLVAAGTGFAQMKSIAEAVLAHSPEHEIDLWWAARTHDELYLDELPRQWAVTYPNVHYHPVVEEAPDEDVDVLVERVDRALAQEVTATSHYSVYLSGSPGMVYAVVDALDAIEPLTERVFSDVFSYAPRTSKEKG